MINEVTNDLVRGYSIVNCLRTLRALAPGCNPRRLLVEPLIINENAVPEDVHYFRLTEEPLIEIISQELQESLLKESLQGVLTVPMKTMT
jgi:hypothetical protein